MSTHDRSPEDWIIDLLPRARTAVSESTGPSFSQHGPNDFDVDLGTLPGAFIIWTSHAPRTDHFGWHLANPALETPALEPEFLRALSQLFLRWSNELKHEQHMPDEDVRDAVNAAIDGFKSVRDFLGLQLNHAWENVSDDVFEQLAEPYLDAKETADPRHVERQVRVLSSLLSEPLDAETISDIFNCRLSDARRIAASVASGTPRSEYELSHQGE